MYISKRLKTIAAMIDDDSHIIDVGCDHGLLDIYAVLHKKNITALAIDSNRNALKVAIKNINEQKLTDKIQTSLQDGLTNIKLQKNDVVVLSGLGTRTIKNVLNQTDISLLDTLIVQSNNDLYDLRKKICKMGFKISDERVVFEKHKYYVIIKFIRGYQKYRFMDYYLGPIIRKNDMSYIQYIIDVQRYVIKSIPKKYMFKILKIKYLIFLIKKELK